MQLALLCILLGGAGFGAMGPFQAIIGVERLGLAETTLALVLAIGAGLAALSSVGMGVLGDQTGRHRLLLALSFGVTALGAGAMAVSPSAWLFLLVHGLILPLGAASMTQTFALAGLATQGQAQDQRARALTLVRAGFSGAYALTPPLCALAVSLGAEILWAYHFMAAVNLLAVAAVWTLWPRDHRPGRPDNAPSPLAALVELAAPVVLLHVALIALMMCANFLPNTLVPLMVVTELGGHEAHVGLIAGVIAGIEIPVMLVAARLAARIGRSQAITLGMGLYAVFLVGLWRATDMGDLWPLLLPAGLGAGLILSLPLALLQDLLADRPGAGGALIAVTNVSGMLLAAGLFALGAERVGLGASAALAAVLSCVAALGLWAVQARHAKDA